MGQIVIVFGPPGTGKTRFCVETAAQFLADGRCLKNQIAFTTFQRAAAKEAAERAGLTPDEYRQNWYRTLHSICYRLLGLSGDKVVTPRRMIEFSRRIGIEMDASLAIEAQEAADLAEVLLSITKQRDSDENLEQPSRLLATYHLSRLACRTPRDLAMSRAQPHPRALNDYMNVHEYRAMVAEYESWKRQEGLVDFVDMLERTLLGAIDLPYWKFAFVDEAQDMAPLQWAVVEKLFFDRPEYCFLAGDDDQAIMGFQMASAAEFLSYRSRARKIHLEQTHRFGQRVIELAARIAARIPEREEKIIRPAPGVQNKIERLWEFDAKLYPGRKFLLHRHKVGCVALARELMVQGIPFWNERGMNPLAKSSKIATFQAVSSLSQGKPIDAHELSCLLNSVPSYRQTESGRVQLIKHGSKKKLLEAPEMVSSATFRVEDLRPHFTEPLWAAIRNRDYSVIEIEFGEYYEQLAARGWRFGHDEPEAVITTIHASKGRQMDDVFLWDEVLPKCLADPDGNENRVSYVGATRVKRNLYIMSNPVTTWQTTRYPYPLQDEYDEVEAE